MNHISSNELCLLRLLYTKGTTVELIEMHDPRHAMPEGLKGIVNHVDDIGGIHISWENGSTLSAFHGIDKIKIIKKA